MTCDKCGSSAITYYRQRRKDGMIVVTARCDRGHHPITGKPFYPVSQFDISTLPMLPGQEEQPRLFDDTPRTGMFIQSTPTFRRLMDGKK